MEGSSKDAGKGKVVCVTGASGFIASWLVKLLLLRGYSVRGTVRDLNDSSKVEHLLRLEGAKERLKLMKANLLEEGSFDSVVHGCDGVFHTASPVSVSTKDPQTELIEPAVRGTLNVLKSCAKTPSVKRVVLTSSMIAVMCSGKPLNPYVIVDETWFSDPDACKKFSQEWSGYALSKTLAEEAAWNFTKENNIDMVTINPAMVIGPLLQPTLNASTATILNLLNGAMTFANGVFGWLNVKDVANVHIQAFEIPSANGRYCLAESVKHYSEIVDILHEMYPTLQLPDKCVDDEPLMPTYQISKEKSGEGCHDGRSRRKVGVNVAVDMVKAAMDGSEGCPCSVFIPSIALEHLDSRSPQCPKFSSKGLTPWVVCVTGASGFIASWLVKLLLLRGYSVRGTVRDLNDSSKVEHLLRREGAKQRLKLMKANLLEEGSFDSVVDGCDGVFHTASPVLLSAEDPQAELIEPAVKGTLNVLKSCAKSSSVKRVVLTSSMATVLCNGRPLTPDVIAHETWFSHPYICKKMSQEWSGYVLSKTLAEEDAWKFTKENDIDMVTINPAMVIGPLLQPTLNASTVAILTLLNGNFKLSN